MKGDTTFTRTLGAKVFHKYKERAGSPGRIYFRNAARCSGRLEMPVLPRLSDPFVIWMVHACFLHAGQPQKETRINQRELVCFLQCQTMFPMLEWGENEFTSFANQYQHKCISRGLQRGEGGAREAAAEKGHGQLGLCPQMLPPADNRLQPDAWPASHSPVCWPPSSCSTNQTSGPLVLSSATPTHFLEAILPLQAVVERH